jgi:hypothetical protein
MVLAAPTLWSGLAVDDFMHRGVLQGSDAARHSFGPTRSMFDFASSDPDRIRLTMEAGVYPWWSYEYVHLSFWRPLTQLTHRIDYTLWPDSPFMMHAQNIAWWAACVLLATVIYRRLMQPVWLAGLAALLFAIDDGHAMPIGWIANRNAVIALCFGLAVLLCHIRFRETNCGRYYTAALLLLPLGLMGNEGMVAVGGYLFAYAITLDKGTWRGRLGSLLPYFGIVVVWRIAYKVLGYGAAHSAAYIDPASEPLRFANAVFERLPVLFHGQWGLVSSETYVAVAPPLQPYVWGLGLGVMIVVCALMVPLLRRDRTARFFALGMILAFVPACSTFTSDRLLLFASFGAVGLIAQLIVWFLGTTESLPRPLMAFRVAGVLLVIAHLVAAPVLFPLRNFAFMYFGRELVYAALELPYTETDAGRTLVVADCPNVFFSSYVPLIRQSEGLPAPSRIRNLAPNAILPMAVTMTREDAHTLVVKPEHGFPWMLVRSDAHPLAVGEVIELSDVRIEVRALSEHGWPDEVAFRFDKPLEDPGYMWVQLTLDDMRFTPFTLPAIGETIRIRQ